MGHRGWLVWEEEAYRVGICRNITNEAHPIHRSYVFVLHKLNKVLKMLMYAMYFVCKSALKGSTEWRLPALYTSHTYTYLSVCTICGVKCFYTKNIRLHRFNLCALKCSWFMNACVNGFQAKLKLFTKHISFRTYFICLRWNHVLYFSLLLFVFYVEVKDDLLPKWMKCSTELELDKQWQQS